MEITAGDSVLSGDKLIQSIDSERVTSSFPEENLAVVDSNYAHYTSHDTSQISLNNETNSCIPHYTSETISTENNSNDIVSTEPIQVQQEYYSFQQEKASDQYVIEKESSSEDQNVPEEKVDTSEYVLENQTENMFLTGQEANNVVSDEAATEEIIIQESEPSTLHYIDNMNDNFESQYVSEVQDTSTEEEAGPGTENKVENLEEKIEELVEEVPEPVIVNKNMEIENEQQAVEIIQTTGLEQSYNENDVKIEASVPEVLQDHVILEETVHEVSEPASSIEDSMEIQTSSEIEESFVDRQDDVELTSSQIVEGEDGTILTVETYRTLDISKDSENPPKTVVEVAPPKMRKTRKPPFDVPMHVLGVDISKPNESVPNGRPAPKPRLGVKVPYRNLTSQIVSKAEIEEEIMERSRQKQKANTQFARSLTQRLARKIAPITETVSVTDGSTMSLEEEEAAVDDPLETNSKEVVTVVESNTIENDSDLLAILEGDGEDMPVLPKEVQTSQEDETNLKALEREIALQQLQDLPSQEPKPRIFRSRQMKVPVSESPVKSKSAVLEKTPLKPLQEKSSDKNKENSSKQSTSHSQAQSSEKKDPYNIDTAVSPKKIPIEVEPQVKVNMVLKTYSRKRKISENKDMLDKIPPPKKPSFDDPDVKIDIEAPSPTAEAYVTKSSRVIKKKVIWDPAEAQPRTLKTITKSTEVKTSPVIKSIKTEKASSQEKSPEKKVEKPVVKKDKNFPEKKVRNESPKTNKSPPKNKKPRSEIDKLLMDEGAVKMLYELNNEEPTGKKKKDFYSVDRAERDILKKANQLKNELKQNSDIGPQKSLRKKESFTPSPGKPAVTLERKMSKDSTLSSVQNTPPGSPFPSQGSMLIRRRSSSSISSSDNNFEMDELVGKITKRKSEGSKSKKAKKSTGNIKQDVKDKVEKVDSPVKVSKTNQFKAFTIKRIGKNVNIDLNYVDEKCYFSLQVLEELTSALKRFSKDKECLVVTLSSSSKAFCWGLDYMSLVIDNEDERKERAKCMTDKVRDFLMCLLQFPKILIASIQGDCIGLGVTMLPLFDMVIASDKATFSTPYSKLGCMSEAGFLLSFPNFTNHGLAAELLYTGQTLTADDAYRRGLVTRLCWPEKYKDTLKNIIVSISQGSKQSLESMKKQLRSHAIKQAEEAINTDMKILIDHWTSAECQKNFSQMESLI